MSQEPMIIDVTVNYKGMYSALKIDISEYKNEDHYLEIIKDHINIAKNVIDNALKKAYPSES
jgi:hypothetical protein